MTYKNDNNEFWIKKRGLGEMDAAVLNYYKEHLNIRYKDQNGTAQKVPCFFATAERRYMSDNPTLLDKNGTLKKPFMRLRRTAIDRAKNFYGFPGDASSIQIAKQLHGKTSNIQNMEYARWGRRRPTKVVYEVYTIPFPDYFTAMYELEINTVYISQMNNILETIWQNLEWINMFKIPDYDAVDARKDFGETDLGGFFYVGIQELDIRDESNLDDYTDQEREIKQVISFKVGGVIVGNTQDMPEAVAKEEGFVQMTRKYTSYKIKFGKTDESFIDPDAY